MNRFELDEKIFVLKKGVTFSREGRRGGTICLSKDNEYTIFSEKDFLRFISKKYNGDENINDWISYYYSKECDEISQDDLEASENYFDKIAKDLKHE